MNYRRLGNTGLKVSEIALGSSILYRNGSQSPNIDNGVACIRRAFELGINFFDTADAYERGETERVLGLALRDLPREQVVVATKFGFPVWVGPLGRGGSRKHIVEAVNHSLERLGIDYIDLYQIHKYDDETPIAETLEALDLLVRQGKVLYLGCSNFSALQLCDANHRARHMRCARFESSQMPYSLLVRGIEDEHLPLCRSTGVSVIAYSPLARGLLTGKYVSANAKEESSVGVAPQQWRDEHFNEANVQRVARLREYASQRGWKTSHVALAWILRRAEVASCIIGAQSPAQVDENTAASDLLLGEQELSDIEMIMRAA